MDYRRRSYFKKSPYRCLSCGYRNTERNAFLEHLSRHLKSYTKTVENLIENFRNDDSMSSALSSCNNRRNASSVVYSSLSSSSSSLSSGTSSSTSLSPSDYGNANGGSGEILQKCIYCPKSFFSLGILKLHMAKVHRRYIDSRMLQKLSQLERYLQERQRLIKRLKFLAKKQRVDAKISPTTSNDRKTQKKRKWSGNSSFRCDDSMGSLSSSSSSSSSSCSSGRNKSVADYLSSKSMRNSGSSVSYSEERNRESEQNNFLPSFNDTHTVSICNSGNVCDGKKAYNLNCISYTGSFSSLKTLGIQMATANQSGGMDITNVATLQSIRHSLGPQGSIKPLIFSSNAFWSHSSVNQQVSANNTFPTNSNESCCRCRNNNSYAPVAYQRVL